MSKTPQFQMSATACPLAMRVVLTLFLHCITISALPAAPAVSIAADAHAIRIKFARPNPPNTPFRVLESPSHSGLDGSANPNPIPETEIWSGIPSEEIVLPRFDQARDRLFSRFRLWSPNSPLLPAQHVSQIDILTPTRPPTLASKKGITCGIDSPQSPTDVFPRINQNIDIAQLLTDARADSPFQCRADGLTFPLNTHAVRDLDNAFQRAKRAGQEVTGILLASQSKSSPRPPHIVHPLASPETTPIGPAAFDTATPMGLLTFRAVVGWLAERYGSPESDLGSLEGLVIGNEIQSHWSWYHLGEISKHLVLNEYAIAVRTADLATRSKIGRFNVYVSLDHHWNQPAKDNPLRGFSGREALETLHHIFRSEGDFPWHIAFHPYPENLFNPAFWNDRNATLSVDSPKITFKNIEVLAAFLRQPHFQFDAKTRHIALTEQGFHCPDQADGPAMQAAAFALAWKKVQSIPEIISFLYHRHVDHPHENGLRCGIFAHNGSQDLRGVGERRPIADLLRAAGTAEEDEVFHPYLAILGRSDWHGVVRQVSDLHAEFPCTEEIVLNRFIERLSEARGEKLAEIALTGSIGGVRSPSRSLRTHPIPGTLGTLTFTISIPDAPPSRFHTFFRSKICVQHPKSTGGTFSVILNGSVLVERTLEPDTTDLIEVDLTRWAGQTVSLSLGVHPGKDTAYDWMTWGDPSLLMRPARVEKNR